MAGFRWSRTSPVFFKARSMYFASPAARGLSTQSLNAFPRREAAAAAGNGLYGFETLKTAQGFRKFTDEAILRYRNELPEFAR